MHGCVVVCIVQTADRSGVRSRGLNQCTHTCDLRICGYVLYETVCVHPLFQVVDIRVLMNMHGMVQSGLCAIDVTVQTCTRCTHANKGFQHHTNDRVFTCSLLNMCLETRTQMPMQCMYPCERSCMSSGEQKNEFRLTMHRTTCACRHAGGGLHNM